MSEPRVLQVTLEDNGDIQLYWTRDDHTETQATFMTTMLTREGIESDPDLDYYVQELRGDAHEVLMNWLRVKNRAASVESVLRTAPEVAPLA